MTEHSEQTVVFAWARLMSIRRPELDLLFAIPNGAKLPWMKNRRGERFSPEAERLKDEGLRPGVPDMFLSCARRGFHGLYIEMKYGRNKPTAEQIAYMNALAGEGYLTAVCYSADDAIEVIKDYLSIIGES